MFQGAPEEVLTISTARDARDGSSSAINEPVLGYRAWLVESGCDGYQLRGVLEAARWASTPSAWTSAVCRVHAGDGPGRVWHDQTCVPHPDCTCGLYAYHSLSIGGYDQRFAQPLGAAVGIVWGAVIGAGRVLVYEDGWRAQLARPVALLQGSGSERDVRGAANRLGIPVVPNSDIARVAAEFGRSRRLVASPSRVSLNV
jgi:hypothetical protein